MSKPSGRTHCLTGTSCETALAFHNKGNNVLHVSTLIPSAVEQMLLLLPENWLKNNFLKSGQTEGHLGRTHRLAAAGIELVTFSFSYGLQKALGQPDSLECSLAGLACLVTFNQLPRDACLALSSAFYKVPQSQAVHKQVGIIIKYDY